MQRNVIEQKLRILFHDLFGIAPEELTEASSPDTIPAWDSLQQLNLVVAIEQEFAISLSDEQIVEMLNFGLVVEIVSAALEAR